GEQRLAAIERLHLRTAARARAGQNVHLALERHRSDTGASKEGGWIRHEGRLLRSTVIEDGYTQAVGRRPGDAWESGRECGAGAGDDLGLAGGVHIAGGDEDAARER